MQNHLDLLSASIDKNMAETEYLRADNLKLWEIVNYLQTENTKLWNAMKSSQSQLQSPAHSHSQSQSQLELAANSTYLSLRQPSYRHSMYESPPPIGLDSVSQNSLSGDANTTQAHGAAQLQELDMDMLNDLSSEDTKILLGQRLYGKIEPFEPVLAARIMI